MNAASDVSGHEPGDRIRAQMLPVSRNGKGSNPYRGARYDLWQRLFAFLLVGVARHVLPLSPAALSQSDEVIHDLAGKLITAQEEERKRGARDLHDIAQPVAMLCVQMEVLLVDLPEGSDLAKPLRQLESESMQDCSVGVRLKLVETAIGIRLRNISPCAL